MQSRFQSPVVGEEAEVRTVKDLLRSPRWETISPSLTCAPFLAAAKGL